MLCAQCSELIKPVVAVDIDGTLGNYHRHFLEFARVWLGRAQSSYPYNGRERFADWFIEAFETDLTTFRSIKLAYRQGGMKRTMPIVPGAWDLVHRLNELGAEVWFTTTRPWERYDRVDPDTKEWLRRHRLVGHALLFSEHKLDELAMQVDKPRVVAVLDDEAEQVQHAERLDLGQPLQLCTAYNREARWAGDKVLDLYHAASRIEELITQWEGAVRWLEKVDPLSKPSSWGLAGTQNEKTSET